MQQHTCPAAGLAAMTGLRRNAAERIHSAKARFAIGIDLPK